MTAVDYALVKDGVVQAVALHPCGPEAFGADPDGEVLPFEAGTAVHGSTWDGATLTAPAAPAVDPVPEQVPMWRVRVILAEDGIVDAVDAAVAALPDDTPEVRGLKQRWLGKAVPPNFVRNSPNVQGLIATLGPTLGLTAEALDAILIRAAALVE